jgi:hypothetical protein
VQVQPAPLTYAWADWYGPEGPDGQRLTLGAILRLDTLYGRIYGFFEPPGLGSFLGHGRLQLLRLPGGDELAARAFTSGIVIASDLPDRGNGQPPPFR